ncbi:MAG TPA: DUF1127 domain-containing protein [Albidovulum sp.]|uniref:DUF1127 domain-containing protein n=1 Tax=Albidovulum sp. TaxID=1872424 RepID=UPI002C87058E|nr:DUF1127 domain-containing protein [Albidovulum sp.]
MAYANATRTGEWGIVASFNGLVTRISDARRRYRVYRQTVAELNALNDRDLADLGIARSSITSIATEAAYGN